MKEAKKQYKRKNTNELTNINGISNLTKSIENACEPMFYR